MVSFIFGGGSSSLWEHDNLSPVTHDWLRDEFGAVPLSFFQEIARAVRAGHVLPAAYTNSNRATTPGSYSWQGSATGASCRTARKPASGHLQTHQPERGHALHIFPGYGHLDLFIGRDAEHDIFPTILSELAKD